MSDNETERQKYVKDTRIACRYGAKCYQKNSVHLDKYKHPPKKENKDKKGSPPTKRRRTVSPNDDETNTTIADKQSSPSKNKDQETKSEDVNQSTVNTNDNKNVEENDTNKQISSEDSSINSSSSSISRTPKDFDVKQFIKEKFLVDMPKDFYNFWEFCRSIYPKAPENALKDVDLTLVGPYDVLAGKFYDIPEKSAEEYLIHWRYYYDPPEFQTVLKGSDKTGHHIGYLRDSPNELPVILASNHSKKDGTLKIMGDNIFAAVNNYLEELKKYGDPFKKMAIDKIQKKICQKAGELNLDLREKSQKIRDRSQKIVTRSFNKMGIVVPYDRKTQVGYRDLGVSNKEFSHLLTKIKEALPEQQKKHMSDLQQILTGVSIATDECDFGTGLELGLDILAYGIDCLNSTALRFLAISYRLLQREAFAKIAEAHLNSRKKGVNLSIL